MFVKLIVLGNGEVLRHLNRRKIGLNCRCVNCLDFKQNGMPMALMFLLQISCQVYSIQNLLKYDFLAVFYIKNLAIKVGMIVEKFYFVTPYYQLSLLAYKE